MPPTAPILDGEGEAKPTKIACSTPPDGRSRWTLQMLAVNLVIIDEFGYQPLSQEESHLFFRVVNYRYAKGASTAITTNKGIESWPSVPAGDEVLAGAILDRLLHSATVLNIQDRSYRLKELDAQVGSRSTTTTAPNEMVPTEIASGV